MSEKLLFPDFLPNQILTNTQLNQLREHLESETRETRTRLTGSGIVCGLHFAVQTAGVLGIRLELGFGLSSEGEFLGLCEPATYTHFRDYEDPLKDDEGRVFYEPWRREADPTQQIDIKELVVRVTGEPLPEGAQVFNGANLPTTIANRVLVLYLERERVDLNTCLVTSCDNKGRNVELNVRALLVLESDVSKFLQHVTNVPTLAGCKDAPELERIPRLHTRRTIRITSPQTLDEKYQAIIDAVAPGVVSKINQLFMRSAAFFDLDSGFRASDLGNDLGVGQPPAGAAISQYRYDAMKDVASAYNEAALAAHAIITRCCPVNAFPRHLLLGALDGSPGYRNEFEPSPVRNVVHGDFERVRDLFRRVQALSTLIDFTTHPANVRIVPSHDEQHALGRRAVPFYFQNVPDALWRPRGRCLVDLDWPFHEPSLPVSLDFDYSVASLLRVEGHVGKAVNAAVTAIENAREHENAEFALLVSSLDDPTTAEDDARRQLQDRITKRGDIAAQLAKEVQAAVFVGSDGESIPVRARQVAEFDHSVLVALRQWSELRTRRRVHCDLGALENDYLGARAELFCILSSLRGAARRAAADVERADPGALPARLDESASGIRIALAESLTAAILAMPAIWGDPQESAIGDWRELRRLATSAKLKLGLRAALESIAARAQALLNDRLPKDVRAFDFASFLRLWKELARDTLRAWLWMQVNEWPLFGVPLEDGDLHLDAPLHPSEQAPFSAEFLAITKSCVALRLAAIEAALEASLRGDLSIFANLSERVNGLEHLAGVSKGGTLVLVCSGSGNSAVVVGDFALESRLPCCCAVKPSDLCFPPSARLDHRIVAFRSDELDGSPVRGKLVIRVLDNDSDPNGRNEKRDEHRLNLTLPSDRSELGAKLLIDEVLEPDGTRQRVVVYEYGDAPIGAVDSFVYEIELTEGPCQGGRDIGHVLVGFMSEVKTGRIVGSTRDEETGAIVGVRITTDIGGRTTESDDRGLFAFENLEPGSYALQATHPDGRQMSATAVVSAGSTETVSFLFGSISTPEDPEQRIRFTFKVVFEDGVPVTGATVMLFEGSPPVLFRQTATQGNVAIFPDVPVGGRYSAVAARTGLIGIVKDYGLAQADVNDTLVLARIERIEVPDDILGNDGILPDELLKIDRFLDKRYLKLAEGLDKAGRAVGDVPEYRATRTFFVEATNPELDDKALMQRYDAVATALAEAVEAAPDAKKPAYQNALKAATTVLLDRLMFSNADGLRTDTKKMIKRVAAIVEATGLDPAQVGGEWAEGMADTLPLSSTEQIKGLMK